MESTSTIERRLARDPDEPARILVTDDRPECLRLIDRSLGEGYRCEFAGDSAQARRHLGAQEFDLALCDIEMPGESGLELARDIAAEQPMTAVVLVTGVDDPEVAEAAFEFGAHGYLVKPFWPGQLLITVMNALERRRLEIAERAHSAALEDRLERLMDRAPVSIYVKDRKGRFLLANKAAHEALGAAPGEMIGRHSADVFPADLAESVARVDEMILNGGGTFEDEETVTLGQEERTVLTVKFPYLDDRGEIAGVYGISTDITDKKRAERLGEELARAQARAIEELQASRQETVDRLAKAIEMHDAGTGQHISRMAEVAAFLGELCGLDREQTMLLRAAAPMHDVGKVATPDGVLRKEGPLTPKERVEMERHTLVGHEILAGSESALLQMAAEVALTHHEHWDGGGYPHGLSGQQIPLEGRIVAVADVLDALLSDRSYRPAMSIQEAVEIIREGRGSHFDPKIVDLLLEHLDEVLTVRGV